MFSQSVELFEFLKQHVAGRSKRMANSQELGAAFRFSLAGLDGRVQPRFSPTGWMIWFFQKSGPASRQQDPVHWRSIPLQEMMFVWSISWKHCHPKATELHTEGANSCLIRTDRKHPAESPFPKAMMAMRIANTSDWATNAADHQIDFRKLRFCLACGFSVLQVLLPWCS